MNTIEIDIDNYLSASEIKEIVKDMLISQLKYKIEREADRLLSNLAYYQAEAVINSLLTDEQKVMVNDKTTKIIQNMAEHTVFYRDWRGSPDNAVRILNKAVNDNAELITDKVKEVINNYPFEEKLEYGCLGILHDAIIKKLSKKEDE